VESVILTLEQIREDRLHLLHSLTQKYETDLAELSRLDLSLQLLDLAVQRRIVSESEEEISAEEVLKSDQDFHLNVFTLYRRRSTATFLRSAASLRRATWLWLEVLSSSERSFCGISSPAVLLSVFERQLFLMSRMQCMMSTTARGASGE
jgi:hypothetical protein